MTPKKLLARYFPDPESVRNHKHLRCFGTLLANPGLWHVNRCSVARAFAVGVFCAFIPVPFQMVLAAGGAILFHCNIPIAVALVWLTNPITMPPVFYFCYRVGAWLLGLPASELPFEANLDWLVHSMMQAWQPFLLGCLICGIVFALLSWCAIHIAWRAMVAHKWKRRRG
ncbi:MAG: DUF2062 domain-containing protein [Zetaproteobacteria bacterium]|nr:MAG: DUF2062 domain-containing protein [Zetaproteobacteria bacterium]